jgi:hypothetical protein
MTHTLTLLPRNTRGAFTGRRGRGSIPDLCQSDFLSDMFASPANASTRGLEVIQDNQGYTLEIPVPGFTAPRSPNAEASLER